MKMKIVLLMLVAMVAITQAELLTNPGFEDGTYGPKNVPDGWSIFYAATYSTAFTWHSTGGVGGGKCLELAYAGMPYTYYTGFAGQYVAVSPGDELSFSVWAKSPTQGTPANPYGYFTWFNTASAWISYGFLYPTGASTVGDDWTQVNFGSLVAPETAASLGIWLYGNSAGCLYDDASLTLVPEPVTLSLLGLGALMLRRRK